MPTYEYRCPSCKHEFEEIQSMKAAAIEICPACGKKTERVISGGAGLIFKGSGFYITDYRSESYKKDSKADNAASSDSPKTSSETGTKKDSGVSKTSSESKKSPASGSSPSSGKTS